MKNTDEQNETNAAKNPFAVAKEVNLTNFDMTETERKQWKKKEPLS